MGGCLRKDCAAHRAMLATPEFSVPPEIFEKVSRLRDVSSRAAEALRAQVDEELERRLRELGPGWAVGWRIQPAGFYRPITNLFERPQEAMTIEYHAVEIVDGKLSIGLNDFHYVTLKDHA